MFFGGITNNNAAINMTLVLIVVALCACGIYIAAPFVRLARRMPLSVLTPPVAYFSAIGMGFMLIEISQMQRLMVFLGHPVYGLSVVLFTILLFGGLGSATVGAVTSRFCPGCSCRPTLMATSARRSSLTGSIEAEGERWWMVMGVRLRFVDIHAYRVLVARQIKIAIPLGIHYAENPAFMPRPVWARGADTLFWAVE